MTYSYPASAVLGPRNSGLSHVGYLVESASGTVLIERTESGVAERVNVNDLAAGTYGAAVSLVSTWGIVRIVWDAADADDVSAVETVNCANAAQVVGFGSV